MFTGFATLGSQFTIPVLVRNPSGIPVAPDSLPTFRVYAGATLVATGTSSRMTTGAITGASNNTPITITSASHNLVTGALVAIEGVGGNTAANGTWLVTRVDANTFTLDGSVGNGAYTSGGTWHITGLHSAQLTPQSQDGFEAGASYSVLVQTTISGVAWADTYTFTVV